MLSSIGQSKDPGISLLEVLLCLTILAAAILPTMLVITSASRNTVSSGIVGDRAIVMDSELDRLDGDDPTFTADYNLAGKDTTTYVNSGRPIAFHRRVETNATYSSAMKRRVYFYLYQNSTDAANAPFFRSVQDISTNDIFYDVGLASGSTVIDTAGRTWTGDAVYDATNHVPGYVTGNGGATGSNASAVPNTANGFIFKTWRAGADMRFSFDVEPGNYLVTLYFAERDNTVTNNAGGNKRNADIWIGDQAFATLYTKTASKTNFNICEEVGNCTLFPAATSVATSLNFTTVVGTNKILNIGIKSAAAGTNQLPEIAGISISRR